MKRNAIFGGILWMGIAIASRVSLVRLTSIELLFLLGPLVVVPLGLELCAQILPEENLRFFHRIAPWIQFSAAICVIASFWFSPGADATILVVPWFCFGCMAAVVALWNLIRGGRKHLQNLCAIASFLYLPVGCAWLGASRLGLTPMGFQEPIVLLTAVHFHFAGFAAPLLALAVASKSRLDSPAARRMFRIVAAGVLAGPGLLAAGFVIGPRMKLAAALIVACGETGLALYFLTAIRNLQPRVAQVFVTISAFSVLFAMFFAAVWAMGEFPLQPFVHLDQMARFHGTANALGFVLCGLVGWTIATSRAALRKGESW